MAIEEEKNIKDLMKEAKKIIHNEKTKEMLGEFIDGFDEFEEFVEEKKKDKGE